LYGGYLPYISLVVLDRNLARTNKQLLIWINHCALFIRMLGRYDKSTWVNREHTTDGLEESAGLLWLEGLLVQLAAGTRLSAQQPELDVLIVELQSVRSLAFTGLDCGSSENLDRRTAGR